MSTLFNVLFAIPILGVLVQAEPKAYSETIYKVQ